MKEIIRYQLLVESRIDDVKKQYPIIPADIIDELSANDPSGNNKYLSWMVRMVYIAVKDKIKEDGQVEHYYHRDDKSGGEKRYSSVKNYLGSYLDFIIDVVNNFHKNVDRLTPERVYEALSKTLGHIPTNMGIIRVSDSIHLGKEVLGIHNSKGIVEYETPYILNKVLSFIIKHYPSKSELDTIRKKETVTIYDNDIIKIVAPQSFASSCMYGAQTKWCTTSKSRGDQYFKNYTEKNNVLIYFIFKKPQDVASIYGGTDIDPYQSMMDYELRSVMSNDPNFNKLALHINLNNRSTNWFDEVDTQVQGLKLLKQYINLVSENPEKEFKLIKDKINQYIASKDERSTFKKIFRSGKI